MSKPRIGITANIEIMEAGAHPGMYRAFINYDYVEAVEDAGVFHFFIRLVYHW